MSKYIIISSNMYCRETDTNIIVTDGLCTTIKHIYDIICDFNKDMEMTCKCDNEYIFNDTFDDCEKDDKEMCEEKKHTIMKNFIIDEWENCEYLRNKINNEGMNYFYNSYTNVPVPYDVYSDFMYSHDCWCGECEKESEDDEEEESYNESLLEQMDGGIDEDANEMMVYDEDKPRQFKITFRELITRRINKKYYCTKCKDQIGFYNNKFTKYIDRIINKEDLCFNHYDENHLITVKYLDDTSNKATLINFEHVSA